MTIAVVITLVVLLAGAVVIAVARDSGPTPADVAIGYASALAHRDFDAVYRMTDPEVLQGRNRPRWIAEQEARPGPIIEAPAVAARSAVVTAETARVVLATDTSGGSATVELVCRARLWVVISFTPITSPLGITPTPITSPPITPTP